MTDEIKAAEATTTGAEAKTHTPEETQALITQLREEAKANRLKAQALEDKLTQREREEQAREAELLKEQGKYRELYEKQTEAYTKVKTEAEQSAAYQAAFKQSLDARIATIPEGMRSLVPEGLSPLQLSEWLDKNAALLSNRRAPNLDAGAGSGGGAATQTAIAATVNDQRMANNFRLPLETYMKYKLEMERDKLLPPQTDE